MEDSLDPQYHFCLFCYKTIDSLQGSKVIKRFFNQLSGYVKNSKQNSHSSAEPVVLLKKISAVDNLLNCCDGCEDKIDGFCERYERLKILELELDWKLGQLVEQVNYANILPTRWIHVDNILEDALENNLERKSSNHNVIKKLRECVVDAGNQRKKQSQPRVSLNRNEKLDQEAIQLDNSMDDNTDDPLALQNGSTNFPDKMAKTLNVSDVNSDLLTKIEVNYSDDLSEDLIEMESHLDNSTETGAVELKCETCDKQFSSQSILKNHMELHKHPNEWEWSCEDCGKKFATKKFLTCHKQIHLKRKLKCLYCDKEFNMKKYLNRHSRNKHPNKPPQQNIPDKLPIQINDPLCSENQDKNPIGKFKCPKCVKTFTRPFGLKVHLEMHRNPNEWKWKCTVCPKRFAAQHILYRHVYNSHQATKRFQCPFCLKQFTMPRDLTEHVKFKHKYKDRNRKTGVGENGEDDGQGTSGSGTSPLECEICPRRFSTLIRKEAHFKRFHDLKGNPGMEFVKCKEIGCTAYFLQECQLKAHHKLVHEGKSKSKEVKEKKFTKHFGCPICWKMFSRKSLFNEHMERHKDRSEWKFECEKCGRKFANKGNLKLHMRRHTGEQKYKCKFCGSRYRYVNSLGIHLRKYHGDEEEVKEEIEGKKRKKMREEGEIAGVEGEDEWERAEVKEECRTDGRVEKGEEDEMEVVNEAVGTVVVEDENNFCDNDALVNLEDIY